MKYDSLAHGGVMQIQDARVFFSAGKIKEAVIKPAPFEPGSWVLELQNFSKTWNVTRQRGGDRIFKSLDAAYQAAFDIGFREVLIQHSGLHF